MADEKAGGAVVSLTTTFGAWPLGTLLVAGIFLLLVAMYLVYARQYFNAAASVIASGTAIYWYGLKFWGARYLRSEISKYLGGVEWEPEQQ